MNLYLWTVRQLNPKTRQRVLERDDHKCTNCAKNSDLEVHHIIPIKKGGTDELDNLRTLCVECHKSIEPSMKLHQDYGIKVTRETQVILALPVSLANEIDEKRKDMPRSRYITRLLESALNIPERERTEYV